jgi:hypothetical protein
MTRATRLTPSGVTPHSKRYFKGIPLFRGHPALSHTIKLYQLSQAD